MRLMKDGLVRETASRTEIKRLTSLGYQPMDNTADKGVAEESPTRLMKLTVEELRVMCRERGLDPPASVKKTELAEAVAAYDLTHMEAAQDG